MSTQPPQVDNPSIFDIGSEIEPNAVPATADIKTKEEIQLLKQDKTEAELERYRQDTGERKRYANRVYCLVTGWVIAMFIILLCQGFGLFGWKPLGDTVLSVLVGGSTVSIFGILHAVVSNLFKPDK